MVKARCNRAIDARGVDCREPARTQKFFTGEKSALADLVSACRYETRGSLSDGNCLKPTISVTYLGAPPPTVVAMCLPLYPLA